jgi:hypothetical protein
MPEIEMPPQYTGFYADPQDTEGHVRRAIETQAGIRLDAWANAVESTVSDFESEANLHVEQLEYEHDATYDFSPVLASFVSTVLDTFPPTAEVKSVVSTIMGGIQSSYEEELERGLSGAKLRLHGSIVALAKAARARTRSTASKLLTDMPQTVEDAMTWVDSASTDSDYVGAFCDWMGFAVPTESNTVNPIRQALENPFFGVYQAVRAQLFRIQGVPGLGDDELNPIAWEHDAIEHQRELYRQLGPDAWKTAYDEIR